MADPLISRREAAVWLGGFLGVALLLAATGFTSSDPDSMLYAGLSARIADQPFVRWVAPEWWGLWPRIGLTGLYRDHPIGGFVVPALLARFGVPGEQAAYIVGIAAGLLALVFIARLVAQVTSRDDARAVLILLQVMPVAFVFRVRANQEYAMVLCLLLTIHGLDRVRRSWSGLWMVAAGLSAALLIKGAFIVLTLIGAGVWIVANPRCIAGSVTRPVMAVVIGLGAAAGAALAYDAWYLGVTGEPFWSVYWDLQLGQVTLSTPAADALTLVRHTGFYIVRLLWHPAPWSLALLVAAWQTRDRWRSSWRNLGDGEKRGLAFALAFAALLTMALSPSSRVAERYVFSGTYAMATAGIVGARYVWPRVRAAVQHVDERVPALPALLWVTLMVLRLGVGPWIPRIQ